MRELDASPPSLGYPGAERAEPSVDESRYGLEGAGNFREGPFRALSLLDRSTRRRVQPHFIRAFGESERDALFQRDAHDPEFFSLFLELLGRVAQEFEATGVVQRFQHRDGALEKGHRRELRRDQDQIKVARRERVTPCPGAKSDRLQRRQTLAQRRQIAAREFSQLGILDLSHAIISSAF